MNHEFPPFLTSPHAMINGEANLGSSLLIQFPGMFIDIPARMEWFLCILAVVQFTISCFPGPFSITAHIVQISLQVGKTQRSTKLIEICKIPLQLRPPPPPCVCTWRSEGSLLSAILPVLLSETGSVVCSYTCSGSQGSWWGISLSEILLSRAQDP